MAEIKKIKIGNTEYDIHAKTVDHFEIDGADNVSIGLDAVATTEDTFGPSLAIGSWVESQNDSIAVGIDAYASDSSVVVGSNANASNKSVAVGYLASCIEESSVAIGFGASTQSSKGIAIGRESESDGEDSIALGLSSLTTGMNSVAIGKGAFAKYANSLTILGTAEGVSSIAIGNQASAYQDDDGYGYNIALGDVAEAEPFSIAIGSLAVSLKKGIAIGNEAAAESSDYENDYGCIAIGNEAYAGGDSDKSSVAIGGKAKSNSHNSVAIGQEAQALDMCVAIGCESYTDSEAVSIGHASGASARGVAVGKGSTAKEDCISIGGYSQAHENSIAIGYDSYAESGAVTIGNGNGSAYGDSVVIGHDIQGADDVTPRIAIGSNIGEIPNSIIIGTNDMEYNHIDAGVGSIVVGNLKECDEKVAGKGSIALGNTYYDSATEYTICYPTAADESIAIGSAANSSTRAVAIGQASNAQGYGVAIGSGHPDEENTSAQTYAVSVGNEAFAATSGVAIGRAAWVNESGVAIGSSSDSAKFGVSIGRSATTNEEGVSIGYNSHTGQKHAISILGSADSEYSIAIGNGSQTEFDAEVGGGNGIAIGKDAYSYDFAGSPVAIGNSASGSGAGSIALGWNSSAVYGPGINAAGTTGYGANGSIAIGNGSMAYNYAANTQVGVIAIGCKSVAGMSGNGGVTSGYISIGYNAVNRSPGSIAIGDHTTITTSSYYYSTVVGHKSGVKGAYGTTLGFAAQAQQYGFAAGYSASGGTYSVAVGSQANASGSYSVAVGKGALSYSYGTAVGYTATAYGGYGVAIGYNATAGYTSAPGTTATASGAYAIAIGYGVYASASGSYAQVKIGSSKNYKYFDGNTWQGPSDERDKTDIQEIDGGLGTRMIKTIQPIIFRDNPRHAYSEDGSLFDYDREEHKKGTKAHPEFRASFSAQEVASFFDKEYGDETFNGVINHETYYNDETNEQTDKYFLSYTELIPFMFQAIKEQQDIIEEQEQRILKLESLIIKQNKGE